ncbi:MULTISPECIES: hypothetical protein [unclassified Neptuniibacter]|uniref:hypothetical protein n=1 Tax=unclassified Neptuniibacter TaxID=2630693 RepID=UPI0025E11AEB|nr:MULTISPECIES: hypothetical protein [unclassified Neptuniibacter]
MGSLLSQEPARELINETGKSIQELAESIITDDEVASKPLSITSMFFTLILTALMWGLNRF